MTGIARGKYGTMLAFLLPGLIVYSMVTMVPIVRAAQYSFFDWGGSNIKEFIGLGNYKEIFARESHYWNAFKNSIIYIVFCCVGQVGIGFILSVLLINLQLKFAGIFRAALFIPCILAPVVIGFLGLQIYNARFGMLNKILEALGLKLWSHDWLGDPKTAIFALVFIHIWQFIGYYTVIFLSAAQGIPREILEVADVDGAVGYKKTLYIIIPLLRNAIMVALTICIAGTMKVFDQIFVMTKGGPGNASEVLGMYMYNSTFTRLRYGLGSAISIVILLTSFIVVVIPRFIIDRMAGDK